MTTISRQQAGRPVVPPRPLPTRRYSQVRALRRAGIMTAAAGPCEIAGCDADRQARIARHGPEPARYVYDHCHAHDHIRGVICVGCNPVMALVDARVLVTGPIYTRQRWPALLAHWVRCPDCAAAGAWEAWQTEAEYADYLVTQQIIGLAKPRGRNAVPLHEQINALGRALLYGRAL